LQKFYYWGWTLMSIHATNEDNIEHAHDMIQLDRQVSDYWWNDKLSAN
jgi:hypothetical protein